MKCLFLPSSDLFSDSANDSALSFGGDSDDPFLSLGAAADADLGAMTSVGSLGDSLSVLTEYGLKYDECFDGLGGEASGNNGSHPINITKVSVRFSPLTFKGNIQI